MIAEILAVGTELLLGDILNTNAQYLSRELAAMGIGLLHQTVVGDNPERLEQAVREALSRSDILITTGGLGPTGDDITREIVSQAIGKKLVLHEESLKRIEEYFKKAGRPMTENNRKQAYLPEGAIVFANDWGTAPGCAVEAGGKIVVMLPGPPREMTPLYDNCVKPYLAGYSNDVIASVSLRVFGMGESAVENKLTDLMQGENPTLAPYAKEGEVLLRVTAKASGRQQALELCRPVEEEIVKRLGDLVYGRDVEGLQQVVVEQLAKTGRKVALAESCTGGLVAKRITEVPGSSQVFDCGIVSYANNIKQNVLGVHTQTLERHGAVSRETAAEMAEGVRRLAGADIGVGVTGIAGPGGGTEQKPVGLVYVALSQNGKCFVKKLQLYYGSDEREHIRYLASSHALDMIRRAAGGLGQPDSEEIPAPADEK
ncbi:MAG TPA: competence/damage-inducible protein A [Clostridia bacterium]|nr:competence/damage-inducible protein A [Clostridia bacterium]